ncbi:Prenyltransferase and squalene oxidase repeat protein [Crateriforma conspicua]|uniref:Prenyltransferase and squalene oxidase repeat protein n=2 Tax=Crateriforma conspicua TaxID=2527996 RepID=A0A5C5YAL9_9PLAN|nr:prenyltransferase/squalene oxidase repeat-containing protein [Crateriforma conspicua]QDV61867.1 Prenyltransferase and squalene oxidase repeat protein [Crateriforma conspicua]TWT71883.1 Prenyltransferase and squalene oxidase repeat protein [Crateriforma conspicua]
MHHADSVSATPSIAQPPRRQTPSIWCNRLGRIAAIFAIVTVIPPATTLRADPADRSADLQQRIDQMANRGIEFLRARGQADDGSFSGETGAAVTALAVRAILEHRGTAGTNDPVVRKALKYLEDMVQPDGGIYRKGSLHRNYETSTAVMALVKASEDPNIGDRYNSQLQRAEAFLKDIQWDQGEGTESDDTAYGGAGYGSHSRPDLSNTAFLIEALRELDNGPDDESIRKALTFVLRTQNLDGQGNNTEFADKIGDGGFYYTPAAGGQSKAGETDGGGLRSYGSMTYAGLKSMIYAGLTRDDPRVVAAMNFIRDNYTLDHNPGMGAQGLYYYYHTFAKALAAAGVEVLDDAEGKPHDWRAELVNQLESSQQADGSWVNDQSERWMEGDRQLVTAYVLLALAEAKR